MTNSGLPILSDNEGLDRAYNNNEIYIMMVMKTYI